MLVLASCKSLSFRREDLAERRTELELALYATESANPNPDAPIEAGPVLPNIRVELSGNTLEDMAAQLATMAKLIQQEREASSSLRSEPVAVGITDRAATSRVGEVATKESGGAAADAVVQATVTTPQVTSDADVFPSLPGLPPTAVFEQRASRLRSGDGTATESSQALGTYRGEDAVEPPGLVPLRLGKPSPLAVQVVQLSDDSMLLNADYDALALDLKKALGTTYLRHDDYVLKPGQYKTVPVRRLAEGTHYVGVIAAYHESDLRRWKAVYRLDPTGHRYGVLMLFDEAGATIKCEQIR